MDRYIQKGETLSHLLSWSYYFDINSTKKESVIDEIVVPMARQLN